jgi:hypothetical protein
MTIKLGNINPEIVPFPPSFTPPHPSALLIDSGCTGHYLNVYGQCQNLHPSPEPITVYAPGGQAMHSTHTGFLPLPGLPPSACICHVFDNLCSSSLLSLSLLCDHSCEAHFTATGVTITHSGSILMTGPRSHTTGRWYLEPHGVSINQPDASSPVLLASADHQAPPPIPAIPVPKIPRVVEPASHTHIVPVATPMITPIITNNNVQPISVQSIHPATPTVAAGTTIATRVAIYHAALFSPSISTWCDAIDAGHLTTWSELTSAQVRRYLQTPAATIKGHLDQTRSNQNSTKGPVSPTSTQDTTRATTLNATEPPPIRSRFLFADCLPISGAINTDQTGRFLCPSSRGSSYILLLYDYDINYIHAEPLPSRSAHSILTAYSTDVTLLTRRVLKPLLQRLDTVTW